MRWRAETAYGDPDARPPPEEIARFLTWSARMRRQMRGSPSVLLRIKVVGLVAVMALAVWANTRAGDLETVEEMVAAAGYGGLFAAAVVSGFNVVAPIPVVLFYPLLIESGFAPIQTLLVIAVGMSTGDLLGYLIGNTARSSTSPRIDRIRARADALHQRHALLPYLLMFVYAAAVPLPNELLVIPLAFSGYSAVGVMSSVILGNVIFNTMVALGVGHLFGVH